MAAVLAAGGCGSRVFCFRLRCALGDPSPGLLVPLVTMVTMLEVMRLRGAPDQEEGLSHRPGLPGEQQRLAGLRPDPLSPGGGDHRQLTEGRAVCEAQQCAA